MINVRLGSILAAKGLSQRELARRSNIHPSTVVKLVNGKSKLISFETLDALCQCLQVTPGELIQYEVGK